MAEVTKEESVSKGLEELTFDDIVYKVDINDKVATITNDDEKYYVKKAAEVGIDKKTLEKVGKFDEAYLKGTYKSALKEIEKVFVENKDVENVTASNVFGLGKSQKIEVDVQRARTSRIPGTDETVTKPGIKVIVTSPRYNISKAEIKRDRDALADMIINV